MLIAALLLVFIVVLVFVLALCKAAGEADEKMEQWIRERKKEEAYKWCDDECLHCEQNDWCKFSEVKHDRK